MQLAAGAPTSNSTTSKSDAALAGEIADLLDDDLGFSEDPSDNEIESTGDIEFDDEREPEAQEKDEKPDEEETKKPDEDKPDESEEEEGEESDKEESKESDKEEDEDKGEDDALETLADLAEDYGTDEATLLSTLQVPLADGTTIPLGEVISTYKDAPEAARIAAEVRDEKTSLAERSAAVAGREKDGMQQIAGLLDALITEVEGDTAALERLKDTDQLAYLQQKDALQTKRGIVAQGIQKLRQMDTDQTQRSNEELHTYRVEQARQVARDFPDWVNATSGEASELGLAAAKEIDAHLLSQGYTQEEIDNDLVDARQIKIVWQAAQYKKQAAKAKKINRKLVRQGSKKTLRARTARAGDGKKTKGAALRRRARTSGSDRDAAAVIFDSDILDD